MSPSRPRSRTWGISIALLKWFDANRRSFPWRETFDHPDPYVILFTEIMLQRTRADQVVPVYMEFVNKYPTFHKLSHASDREVVALFARLGLKWRAKNVVRLVRVIRNELNGKIPRSLARLGELPGVGEYVSSAVMCYAFGQRKVPVDANVVRVVSRVFGLKVASDSGRHSILVHKAAKSLLPPKRVKDMNLALLDLAALVCRPTPLCEVCPLTPYCAFYRAQDGKSRAKLERLSLA